MVGAGGVVHRLCRLCVVDGVNQSMHPKAALGVAILNMRLASKTIDALGGDGKGLRDQADELEKVRWASE